MLACREVVRLIASDELERFGWRRRLAVRMHLLMCANCRRYRNQLRQLGEATRTLLTDSPPADRLRELEERIIDRVKGTGEAAEN